MASNEIEKMKEIVAGIDNFPFEVRRASFTKLLMLALKSDDLQLFDWLQSKNISLENEQKNIFCVKTILEAVSYKSNNIILSVLRDYKKFQISSISQIKNTNGLNIFHLCALSHTTKERRRNFIKY